MLSSPCRGESVSSKYPKAICLSDPACADIPQRGMPFNFGESKIIIAAGLQDAIDPFPQICMIYPPTSGPPRMAMLSATVKNILT
eukprot:4405446-Karenia_brevis.AAC.1